MAINKKQTSSKLASVASKTLRNNNSSITAKSLAASVLSQASSKNQTSGYMETKASNVLKSTKYNANTKSLAASVLSQSNKLR
ncbi:MAG: hypothetical protein MJK08_09360 [Campylobacterales bacterium]|nr:hypothetical protein [Campylobacterales bacterium]